jgi:Fe-S-cluster containining protein
MFPCTKCGCCCKRVGAAVAASGISFPYKFKEDGACEMLVDNKCLVYDKRPAICNVDKIIRSNKFNKKFYYKETARECNKMMDEDGIAKEFRIKY